MRYGEKRRIDNVTMTAETQWYIRSLKHLQQNNAYQYSDFQYAAYDDDSDPFFRSSYLLQCPSMHTYVLPAITSVCVRPGQWRLSHL